MQLRLIIPKVPPVKLAHSDVSRAAWTVGETASFLSPSQRRSQRKTPWWKEERFVSTGKAKRSANPGPSTPASSCRLWTGGSSKLSIWLCRREPSSPRPWGSRKHRHVLGFYAFSINQFDFVHEFTQPFNALLIASSHVSCEISM